MYSGHDQLGSTQVINNVLVTLQKKGTFCHPSELVFFLYAKLLKETRQQTKILDCNVCLTKPTKSQCAVCILYLKKMLFVRGSHSLMKVMGGATLRLLH